MDTSRAEQALPAPHALPGADRSVLDEASLPPHWRLSRPFRDLLIMSSAALIVFALVSYYNVFRWWNTWVRDHDLRLWQADDFVFVLAYFGFAFAYFSFRRWRELQAEAAARRGAERLKDEFLHTVSHELRTPLTTIREGVSQIVDGLLGPTTPEQREFLSIVLSDIKRLSRIINDLLDEAKIEAGRLELAREYVNIVGIAQREARLFEPRARAKGLLLQTDFSKPEIEAFADPDKIAQVFANLLGNALKFTEHGEVALIVEDMGKHVSCAVRDTGRGIAPGDLPKVFQKFYQVGRMPGPGGKGTGLGLSIAKAIVESHGGEISARSLPGGGSTFTFVLPKTPA